MFAFKSGFSLIELMVVVSIVGILSITAVPSYNDYMARTQALLVIERLHNIMSKQIEYYSINGSVGTASDLGYTNSSNNIDPSTILQGLNVDANFVNISQTTPEAFRIEGDFNKLYQTRGGSIQMFTFNTDSGTFRQVCLVRLFSPTEVVSVGGCEDSTADFNTKYAELLAQSSSL